MLESGMQAYLDNSATTKPCQAAVDAVTRSMETEYYNPSALYGKAVEAERSITAARKTIADAVDAEADNVIFTSGGTESDNLAILGHLATVRGPGSILYTAAEHPAVKNACLEAECRFGFKASGIPLRQDGTLDMDALREMLTPEVKLICVMQVCNETGVIMPVEAVAALRDELAPQAAIHVDGVQGYLRVPFSMRKLRVQSYALSAHKFHGPKGVGALIVAKNHRIKPILFGGGQQQNLRSGTENTPGITGLAAAVEAYPQYDEAAALFHSLKTAAIAVLSSQIESLRILGSAPESDASAPHILYISIPPVRAETMVHALEAKGVMVGTGSACSSHKSHRSEVLAAMGISPREIDSSIRLSFSVQNTVEEVTYAAEQIVQQYRLLSAFTRR